MLLTEQLRHLYIPGPGRPAHHPPKTVLNIVVIVLMYPVLRWLTGKVGAERLNWW
jgi:hypothetical protein